MKNTTIVKYTLKYATLFLASIYAFSYAGHLLSQKNDIANVAGFALYTGLFLIWVLVLRSDADKVLKNLSE